MLNKDQESPFPICSVRQKWGLILLLSFMVAAATGNEKPRYTRVNIAGQAYPQ
jgi:hypothetical protein